MLGTKSVEWILAPMDGVTDYPYRNAWVETFGAYSTMRLAVSPFVSLVPGGRIRLSHLRDLFPENNRMSVEPQFLGNEAGYFLPMAEALHALGYSSIDWNLGCPVRHVARKQRGSGLLPYPDRIRSFLESVLPSSPLSLSVKLRLGYASGEEIYPVLDVLNSFPLSYVAIHPRTGIQLYGGRADWDAFEALLPRLRHRCVYSGDIDSVAKAEAFCGRFPRIGAIMLGRGVISNPFLPCSLSGFDFGKEEARSLFAAFVQALLFHYQSAGLRGDALLRRQKLFWGQFRGEYVPEGAFGLVKRLDSVEGYVRLCRQWFGQSWAGGWREQE